MKNAYKDKKEALFSSVDQKQINHFTKDSKYWWDKKGPFAALHKLNPVRLEFIQEQICSHYDRDISNPNALEKLDILDIGCGGGLLCEPLARIAANITGLDADKTAIKTAQAHAKNENLNIKYINEDLINIKERYDIVLALEIIEHVNDTQLFIKQCKDKLKPNGLLIISTLNRTPKSFAFGVIAAEYILNWVPKGTHSWKKFIKPSELIQYARPLGLTPIKISGLTFNPLKNEFKLSKDDLSINYIVSLKLSSH